MKTECRVGILALGAWLVASSSALAGSTEGGVLHFAYRQFPFGPYSGTFHAEGSVLDPEFFPPDEPGAVQAFNVFHEGRHTLLIVGGYDNGDASGDLAFVLLQGEQPFTSGVYIVDPVTYSVMFGFLDDADGVVIPDSPWAVDWERFYESILASHKFGGFSGIITLDRVNPHYLEGSFAGYMVNEAGMKVVLSDAAFATGAVAVPVTPTSWADIKAAYRD